MVAAAEPHLELTDDAINAALEALAAHRMRQKQCPGCEKILPMVPAAFRPDPGSEDGFSRLCVMCDIQEQQTLVKACIAEANLSLNVSLHRRAVVMAGRASDQDCGVPHLKSLYQRTIEAFGGPEGLAAARVATFLAAPEGSMGRIKMLHGIDRMAIKVTEAGNADLNVESMTGEELAVAKKRIEDQLRRQLIEQNRVEATAVAVAKADVAETECAS